MPKITDRMRWSADELELYATNTSELYPRFLKIVASTKRIVFEGRENESAGRAWVYRWVLDAKLMYRREIGSERPNHYFGLGALKIAATSIREGMVNAIKNGEYDGEYGTPMVAIFGKPHERAGHLFRHDSDRTTRYMILQVGDPETGNFPWAVWDTHEAKVVEKYNLRSIADQVADSLNHASRMGHFTEYTEVDEQIDALAAKSA